MAHLNPVEVELLVRQLKPIPVEEVGGTAWKEQREAIEMLNYASHQNAAEKKDDFVMTYLIEHEKLVVIIHELLVMEAWRHKVLPSVEKEVMENPAGVYMYCYYESVLVNLLECVMFFEEAVTGFGDDVLELIDYLWRQVSALFAEGSRVNKVEPPPDAKAMPEPPVMLKRQLFETAVSRAMGCVSCLWFVVDRIGSLSMAAMNSVLFKNDLLVGVSEVLVLQPWLRRSPDKVQKFINGQFQEVPKDEFMRVCSVEAHAWFCIHKMLCDMECRRKYQYTSYKKEIILRTKRFMNETLVDQIPALADVQRALEELSFLEPPSGTEEKFKASLVIEQVPRIIGTVDNKSKDWPAIAEQHRRMLADPRSRMEDAQRMAKIFDTVHGMSS